MDKPVRGRCECRKVEFTVESPRETITICHCSQCRRISGHLWAATHAPYASVKFLSDEGLEWYASSGFAKRGFCKCCGSSLFYQTNNKDSIAIAAGCFDEPTGFQVEKHIFVADKGDYYEVMDGKPQVQKY